MGSYQELFELIGVLARRRFQLGEQEFARLGLTHTEARLLTLLDRAGGTAPQEELTRQIHVDRTNAGRALQRLEDASFLSRRTLASDKRARVVQLSAKGRKTADELEKLRKRMAQTFFGDLSEPEARVVVDLLKKTLPDRE